MTDRKLIKFEASLFDSCVEKSVLVSDIHLDDIAQTMFTKANPISCLRSSNDHVEDSVYFFNLLALRSPILCYRYRHYYVAIGGFMTLIKIKRAIDQAVLSKEKMIPVKLINKKPAENIRRAFIQFDVVNDLLIKCFVSDTKKISRCLRSWFHKQEEKRSIYQSEEWLTLFPQLNTAKKLARYLSISEKDL